MPSGSDNSGVPEDGYRYTMGFAVGTSNPPTNMLPDPAGWRGSESDLDTMGERDATGYLHRKMVATKHPIKIHYNALKWSKLAEIRPLLNHEKLYFTFPDPATHYGDANADGTFNILDLISDLLCNKCACLSDNLSCLCGYGILCKLEACDTISECKLFIKL